MLKIKASVGSSKIHGVGLFADEDIPKGTVTWEFDPDFDIFFSPEEVEKMSPAKKEFIDEYGSLSIFSKKYIISIDNTRFINHSSTDGNVMADMESSDLEPPDIAIRDIKAGEEILIDYRVFDVKSRDGYYDYIK